MEILKLKCTFPLWKILRTDIHLLLRLLGLYEQVPVSNRFSRVSKHLIPVVSPKPLGMDPYTTDSNDLIVSHSIHQENEE